MRWWDRKTKERIYARIILGMIAVAWLSLIVALWWALS